MVFPFQFPSVYKLSNICQVCFHTHKLLQLICMPQKLAFAGEVKGLLGNSLVEASINSDPFTCNCLLSFLGATIARVLWVFLGSRTGGTVCPVSCVYNFLLLWVKRDRNKPFHTQICQAPRPPKCFAGETRKCIKYLSNQ